jgi:hypothetical protein
MKKLLLLGCVLLVIALSVVAATTIKADAGNNPRQLVVDAKFISGGPPSINLPPGARTWMKFELYPEDQVVPGAEIGEKITDVIVIAKVGISASFNQELYVIDGKGAIFGSWYHHGLIEEGEGIITGGTGAFHGASGEYFIDPLPLIPLVHRVTFNFDDARYTNP